MVVLGIDPGLVTGVALVGDALTKPKLLSYNVYVVEGKMLSNWLDEGYDIGRSIWAAFFQSGSKPEVAIEEPVLFRSGAVFAAQIGFYAALRTALLAEGIQSHPVNPTKSKLALTGNGRASKEQMVFMARSLGVWPKVAPSTAAKREALADAVGHALAYAAATKRRCLRGPGRT